MESIPTKARLISLMKFDQGNVSPLQYRLINFSTSSCFGMCYLYLLVCCSLLAHSSEISVKVNAIIILFLPISEAVRPLKEVLNHCNITHCHIFNEFVCLFGYLFPQAASYGSNSLLNCRFQILVLV